MSSTYTNPPLAATAYRHKGNGPFGNPYPVFGGDATGTIGANEAVCITTAGYAVVGADTSGLKFRGFARGAIDNAAGASGDKTVVAVSGGLWLLAVASMTLANIDDLIYCAGPATFTTSAGNGVKVGRMKAPYITDTGALSTTHCWVEVTEGGESS